MTLFIKRKRTAEFVKLSNISSEIKEVKDSLNKLFTVTNSMSVPIGLRSMTLYFPPSGYYFDLLF